MTVIPPMGKYTASISYTSKATSGNVAYTLTPCGYTPSAQQENHPSFGVYTRTQMRIDVPATVLAAQVPAFSPKPGDFFTGPDGAIYNVIRIGTPSIFFVPIVGFSPAISYALKDTFTWKQRGGSATATGARQVSTSAATANIPGRAQPTNSQVEDMFGKRGLLQIFNIHLATDIAIGFGDQLIDQNAKVYETFAVTGHQNLQELVTCQAVLRF